MLIFIRKVFIKHLIGLSWQGVVITLASYVALAWIMLYAAGEDELIKSSSFLYWLIVTASTVGYGDLSPATIYGKYIAIFFVIPFGLGLFALVIGRVAAFSSAQWRRGIKGLKMLNVDNHILVIGWESRKTPHLLNLLINEASHNQKRKIVLCTMEDIENPFPGEIEFASVVSLNNDKEMQRTCIDRASIIIINTSSDDLTMTTALYAYSVNKSAHIIVYFADDSLRKLLKANCPTIECTPSVAIEMQVKAAMDPGSSVLHQELLSATHGVTQFSMRYPEDREKTTVNQIFIGLKQQYSATLLGVDNEGDQNILLNPDLSMNIYPGAILYYIATKRIKNVEWSRINV